MLRALTLAVLLIVTALPVSAGFKEGMAAYGRGDHATAFREFKALAEQGDANGQFWLSRSYYFGYGTPKNNDEALRWLRRAASQGHHRAQGTLGARYLTGGDGVTRHYGLARKWLTLSARQGDIVSQIVLGDMYAQGRGGPVDLVRAYSWYSIAGRDVTSTAMDRTLTSLEKRMTRADVAKAQEMAAKWKPKKAGSTK